MSTIMELIAFTGPLAPLPAVATRLAEVLASDRSTIDDIVNVIQYEQGLTAQLLRHANSVSMAASRKVATIREAVIRLGGARVLERMVGHHVRDDMRNPIPTYGYNAIDLWKHSIATALAAESLGAISGQPVSGLCFTAALLHDIGKIYIGHGASPENMDKIWNMVRDKEKPVDCETAERMVLGFSHADVGATLIGAWQLPREIKTAVASHHNVHIVDPVTDCVRVANITARVIGAGVGHEGLSLEIESETGERLGLTREKFEKLCAVTASRLDEVLTMYEIDG